MEVKYAYEKLMAQHKLSVSDLPQDAQIGIRSIKDIDKAINMAEKKGKTVKKETYDKVKSFDKWVVREILDYVEDKEQNTDAPPVAAEEIIEEIKDPQPKPQEKPKETPPAEPAAQATPVNPEPKPQNPADTSPDPKGIKIDEEFAELIKKGKVELSLDELKSEAPTAYGVVFDTYEKGGLNGISTTYFELIEKNNKFNLTKK